MGRETFGTELLKRLHEGQVEQLPSEFLAHTREEIISAIEELIECGARIRPLKVGARQVGWVRGVHLSERKALGRWVHDGLDTVGHVLRLGTTLSEEELAGLSLIEVRSLGRVVKSMTESDLRLSPFLHAFVSTSASEQLWYSRGKSLTDFGQRTVTLPDGKEMRIHAASDQARLWATLCNYRIQAKARVEASFNAVLTIRPMVGKGADPLAADLKAISRGLQTDSLEPWQEVIRVKQDRNLDDGWAHSEDDSIEGMKRELDGMIANDRHEQVIALIEKQEQEREERAKRDLEERITKRRAELVEARPMLVLTEAEVRAGVAARRAETSALPSFPEETQSSLADRLAKYR